MRIIPILFLLPLYSLNGEMLRNLLPEWQGNAPDGVQNVEKQWHFRDWGRRQAGGRTAVRKHSVFHADGKVRVTLENPAILHSANMLSRTIALPPGEHKRVYRFKAAAVNHGPGKALMQFQLIASGKKNLVKNAYFSIGATLSEKELFINVPPGSRQLQIFLSLRGPGKVTLSDLQVTEEALPIHSGNPRLASSVVTLTERAPAEMQIILPADFDFSGENSVVVTLPWGVRLISVSRSVRISRVDVKVKKESVTALAPGSQSGSISRINLLLGSDLPVSEKLLSGSVELLTKGRRSGQLFFRLKTVKDLSTLPPRYFRTALSFHDSVQPNESAPEFEFAQLSSGANVLVAARLNIPERQLKTARCSRRAFLLLPPVKAVQHCYYGKLRDETFWEEVFQPQIHRQILRFGNAGLDALICDSQLGQKQAVSCLCVRCRTELAEFAPGLPRHDVMNLSPGMLTIRYPKELKKFRRERVGALWAGAGLYLPSGSGGFRRPPALIPCFSVWNRPESGRKRWNEAILNLGTGPTLADGKKYEPAVNFILWTNICKAFRDANSSRLRLTARFAPAAGSLTPEELQFELLNLFFCGFSGVWLHLAPGADSSERLIFTRTVMILREYESFFRTPRLLKHDFTLKSDSPRLELPLVPDPSGYPLDLPSQAEPFRLLVWKHGSALLAAVGNFSSETGQCTLFSFAAPRNWRGMVSGRVLSSAELSSRGMELTVPPRSWIFLKFENWK